MCVAGQTAHQKVMWNKVECNTLYVHHIDSTLQWVQHNKNGNDGSKDSWMSVSSPNSLVDVHWLHVGSQNGSSRIEKEKRNVFVKGRIQDVRKQFQVSLLVVCLLLHINEVCFSIVFVLMFVV